MNELYKIFADNLKPLGLSRSRGNFYLSTNELTIVVNLQKSQFSNSYYINMGIWMNSIGGENKKPLHYKCHIDFRIESYYKKDSDWREILEMTLNFFNFEDDTVESKAESINFFIKQYVCNILFSNKTISGLKKSYREGRLSNEKISPEAIKILEG